MQICAWLSWGFIDFLLDYVNYARSSIGFQKHIVGCTFSFISENLMVHVDIFNGDEKHIIGCTFSDTPSLFFSVLL